MVDIFAFFRGEGEQFFFQKDLFQPDESNISFFSFRQLPPSTHVSQIPEWNSPVLATSYPCPKNAITKASACIAMTTKRYHRTSIRLTIENN